MKKISKKLALSIHTVRDLSAGLAGVTGALGSKKCITHVTCPSVNVCITLDPPCTDPTVPL